MFPLILRSCSCRSRIVFSLFDNNLLLRAATTATTSCFHSASTLSSSSSTKDLSKKTSHESNQLTMKQQGSKTQSIDQVSIVQHPVSRLRLFKFGLSPNAGERERRLRQKRIELQNWNHQYWSNINREFNLEKKDYVDNELKNKLKDKEEYYSAAQSHEELANFYKNFLNRNHQRHIEYNFTWYKRNLSLLWPSFLVSIDRLLARLSSSSPKPPPPR